MTIILLRTYSPIQDHERWTKTSPNINCVYRLLISSCSDYRVFDAPLTFVVRISIHCHAANTMTITMQKTSLPQGHSYKSTTTGRKANGKGTDSKGIWLSMLDDVSRGTNLAEKQLIILGMAQRILLSPVLIHLCQEVHLTNNVNF